MTTTTPRTAKAAAVSGTPSFRLECMTLLAASLERELAALPSAPVSEERDAAKWKDPSRVTDALVRYLLDTQIADPKWAAPMTRAIYAALNDEKGEKP